MSVSLSGGDEWRNRLSYSRLIRRGFLKVMLYLKLVFRVDNRDGSANGSVGEVI